MKIAVAISGEPRLWDVTYESFKKFFKRYNYDVYIHTWDSITTPGRYNLPFREIENLKEYKSRLPVDKNFLYTNLKNHYNCKDIIVEDKNNLIQNVLPLYPDIPKEKYNVILNSNHQMFCQLYSMKRVVELIDESKYDIIIRTRFDIYFNIFAKINTSNILKSCLKYSNALHTKVFRYAGLPLNKFFMDFQVLFGSSEIMKKYISKLLDYSRLEHVRSNWRCDHHVVAKAAIDNGIGIINHGQKTHQKVFPCFISNNKNYNFKSLNEINKHNSLYSSWLGR